MEFLAFLKVSRAQVPLGGRKEIYYEEGLDLMDYMRPSNKTLLCQVNARNKAFALKKVSNHFGIDERFIQLCPLVENAGFEEVTASRRKRGK